MAFRTVEALYEGPIMAASFMVIARPCCSLAARPNERDAPGSARRPGTAADYTKIRLAA